MSWKLELESPAKLPGIKLKLGLSSPSIPITNEYSAHFISLPTAFCTCLWRYIYIYIHIYTYIQTDRQTDRHAEWLLANRLSYWGSSWKTWTRHPIPMTSEHSAHSTPLPVGFHTSLWRYTCMLLLISMMLWHRQAISELKRNKLSFSAECRVSDTKSAADWMPTDKSAALLRIKLKHLNSTVHSYHKRAFSPLDPTGSWLSHLALVLNMFVVVYFDSLAQESNIRIKRKQFVSTIRKYSAHSTPLPVGFRTSLWRYTCVLLLISKLWYMKAILEQKGDKLSSSAESRNRT